MSRLDLTDPAELREARAEIERLRQWFAELEATNAELNVEVSRLYACRNELQDVTQAMDDRTDFAWCLLRWAANARRRAAAEPAQRELFA